MACFHIRDNHAGRRGSVGSVEQTNAERPTIRPARVGLEMSEDVFSTATALLGHDKNGDDEGKEAGKRPEDGGSLL